MTVTVHPFAPADAAAFRDLNLAWITDAFGSVEASDAYFLAHPDEAVLSQGGCILMASADEQPVGTVTSLPREDGRMELCKMAVRDGYRGRGIGKALMSAAESCARQLGGQSIWLETSTRLGPAIALYRASGFTESDAPGGCASRCNLQFTKAL